MAQKTFINYKDETKSYELGEKHIGMFKPGRYSGFDLMTTGGAMTVRIGHAGKLPKTNKDQSQTLNFGAILLPSGTVLHEDAYISLTPATNSGNTFPRIDWVIVEHLYEEVVNGVQATYSIIQGPAGGEEPALVDASKQVLIGKLFLVPDGDEYTDIAWTPEPLPFLGDQTRQEFYDSFSDLVGVDIKAAIDAIPHAQFGTRGLVELANDDEAVAGENKEKAITPWGLLKHLDQYSFVVDQYYVHTDRNFTVARQVKLDGLEAGGEPNVQIDWNSDSGMDSILNKPNVVDVYVQGTVGSIDIAGDYTGKTYSVTGDITSAYVYQDTSDETLIQINFTSLGTSNYHPIVTVRSLGNIGTDAAYGIAIRDIQNGSFKVLLDENASGSQNLQLLVTLIAFNI